MSRRGILVALVLLASCGGSKPLKEGTVIDRKFIPAHNERYMRTEYMPQIYTYTVTNCSGGYGNMPRTCYPSTRTGTRMVPHYVPDTRHVPDKWKIRIEQCERKDNGEEKCRQQWKTVGELTYEGCVVGDFWRENESCGLS